MKKERGITLVALIITIIILVILSAVTIQNTIGEHGLIDMATGSAVRSRIAEYKDGLDLIGIEIMTENAPNNLTGREYLEEFKKKVDESELFKDKRSAEIIGAEEGETEEKLRVVTKEGFVYDVTEKEIKYVGSVGEEGFTPLPDLKDPNIEIIPSEKNWVNHPITAKITVSDEFKDFTIQYTTRTETSTEALSGWKKYELETEINIPTNETIFVKVIDNVGNSTKTASKTISNIDRVEPEEPTELKETEITTNSITVTATAKDAEGTDTTHYKEQSGIAKLIFTLTAGEEKQEKEVEVEQTGTPEEIAVKEVTKTCEFTNLKQSTNYTITVQAIDNAGNKGALKTITKTTKTVPGTEDLIDGTITFDYKPEQNTGKWTNQSVIVTISAKAYTDQGYKIEYSKDANSWFEYNDTDKVTMDTNGTIYVRLKDTIGQTGTKATATGTVSNIDKVKPETPTGLKVTDKTTNSIKVTASAKDAEGTFESHNKEQSGIAKIKFILTGEIGGTTNTVSHEVDAISNPESATVSAEWTFTGLTQTKNYTITATAIDKAENESDQATEITDTTKTIPGGDELSDSKTGSISFAYKPRTPVTKAGWTNNSVNVTITSSYTAPEQGGYKLQYAIKNSATTVPQESDWVDYDGNSVEMKTNGIIFARLRENTLSGYQVGTKATATGSVSNIDTIKPSNMTDGKVTNKTTNSMIVTATAKDAVGTDATHYNEESGIDHIIFELKGTISGQQKTLTGTESAQVEGTTETSSSHTFTGLTQGITYTITAKAVDKAGNESAIKEITGGTTGTVPGGEQLQTGAITFTPDKTDWTNETVNVTITSKYTDPENGGYKLQYAIKDLTGSQPQTADWKDYNEAEKVKMTTNGTIYARLRDTTGQAGTAATATQRIDIIDTQTPDVPTGVTTEAVVKDGKKHYIKVTASAQDVAETTAKPGEQSGIAKLQFKIDSGEWQDVTAATTGTVKATNITYTSGALTTASHTIQVQAVDKAGNVSGAVNATAVSIDATNPSAPKIEVISGTPKAGVANTYTSAIKVKITPGTDNVAVQNTSWSTTGTNENGTLTGNTTKELTFSNNGTYTISATTTDTSGNTASSSLTVTKAGTPPTVTASADRSYDNGTHKITITATGKDAEGGTLTYTVSYGKTTTYGTTKTVTGTAGQPVTITIDSGLDMATTYYYKVDVKDTDNTSAQTPYTNSVKTYCVGEWCAGGTTTTITCPSCGGSGLSGEYVDEECILCHGDGDMGNHACWFCNGTGKEADGSPCIICKGVAWLPSETCTLCGGTGIQHLAVECTRCNGNKTVSSTQPCKHSQYSGHYYCTSSGNVVNQQIHDD